jgi:hypothetical protein
MRGIQKTETSTITGPTPHLPVERGAVDRHIRYDNVRVDGEPDVLDVHAGAVNGLALVLIEAVEVRCKGRLHRSEVERVGGLGGSGVLRLGDVAHAVGSACVTGMGRWGQMSTCACVVGVGSGALRAGSVHSRQSLKSRRPSARTHSSPSPAAAPNNKQE